MTWVTILGYLAAGLVAATFYAKSMIPLRCFAVASNVCFIFYAYFNSPQLYPILALHAFLLPLNINRLWHLLRVKPSQFKWVYQAIGQRNTQHLLKVRINPSNMCIIPGNQVKFTPDSRGLSCSDQFQYLSGYAMREPKAAINSSRLYH